MIVESYEDVIVLSGAIRQNLWETIHTAISLTLRRHPSGVIIDCEGITEMTNEGAETFHDAIDFVGEHGKARIIMVAVKEDILAVLRSVPGVRSQLAISDSVESARKSIDLLTEGDDEDGKRKKKGDSAKPFDRHILAILSGDDSDNDVLEVINELVSTMPAKVLFLLPIVVPRALPLQAPMPENEEKLAASAQRGKESLADSRTACEIKLERTRSLPTLLHQVAEQVEAAYTVVSLPRQHVESNATTQLIQQILKEVDRPVLFVSGQQKS